MIFIVAKNSKNLGVEVAVTVARDAELQAALLPIDMLGTIAVALVAEI